MNNMGREIMAALKRFQVGSDGDGVTVGGALVVSGATTANTFSATAVNATGTVTFSGSVIFSGTTTANTFSTDLITEKTSAAGVTIDGVLLKDSGVVTGAGTVSAPVYSTTGDLNTGIYFPSADTIGFAEGGAQCGEFDSSANFKFNSGYGSVATAYGCRAWVNFNGSGTVAIRASGNVTSITDNGTGDYTVNFTTAMPDANYNISGGTGDVTSSVVAVGFRTRQDLNTTSGARIISFSGNFSAVDLASISIAIFR
jgi:type 1 fimbria pilin